MNRLLRNLAFGGIMAMLALLRTDANAIDAACTQTTNLSIYRCPQNSTDWFDSYTGIVDNLDALARTAPSSFTVIGASLFRASIGGVAASGGLGVSTTLTVVGSSLTVGGELSATLAAIGANTGQVVLLRTNGAITTDTTQLTWDSANDTLSVNGLVLAATQIRAPASGNITINSSNGDGAVLLAGAAGERVSIGRTTAGSKLHMSSGTLTVDGTSPAIIVGSPAATPVQGSLIVHNGAAQTIAAGNTITADACGGIKTIDAGGAVTTDTTNTFTAPAASNRGCCMDVINIDTVDTITLDANPNFNAAADIVMTPCDAIRVCSDGTDWFPDSSLAANTCN